MIKFGKSEKTGVSGFSSFRTGSIKKGAKRRFEDPSAFEARKRNKKHQ
jgi:hypothetical protein